MLGKNLIKAAAAKAQPLYIEDVMSTWLYTGNDSTQTITNGIDLAGEGGMVWIKGRSAASNNILFDTAQGSGYWLITNKIDASLALSSIFSFNATGFSLLTSSQANTIPVTYASWTFRKAPKFFDVVTYTGTGGPRAIAHNLGSVPGFIIIKSTSVSSDWRCYHRSLGATQYIGLNLTNAAASASVVWNNTEPTSTEFTVGTDGGVNSSGQSYVAYLFAHDAGGFGDSGTESVIKCGSYTGNGSTSGPVIDLGWEPQWVLVKCSAGSGAGSWALFDNMRGVATGGVDAVLLAQSANAENSSSDYIQFNATGFSPTTGSNTVNGSGLAYIYIAIRRGPMKTPTSGAEVFSAITGTSGTVTTGFPVDLDIAHYTGANASSHWASTRLTGAKFLATNSTAAEVDGSSYIRFDSNTSFSLGSFLGSNPRINWSFRRAPGFFDVVAYTGTGVARTVPHNLGVAPELMIVKKRSAIDNWIVYAGDATDYLILNTTAATADLDTMWNDTAPTASVFSLGTNDDVNGNAATFIAYLFGTVAGVSKVGSYTGTGTTLQVDCGFASGARLVLIKRTDSSGDWYVWDTARGIVSGNDPYLVLNESDPENTSTDYIDPYSAGFEISSTAPAAINASGGSFIYLAIA